MADLTFSQPARRNLTLPILLAVAVLIIAAVILFRVTPRSTADVAVTHTAVYQSHVVFKSNSIVLNSDQAQDDIYVLTTLRITNHLRLPLFLKDFTATLTPASASPIDASAVEKPDLANLYITFPALKDVASAQSAPPLYRETEIKPGQTVEGFIVLHFPGAQTLWDNRTGASLSINLYHQAPLTVEIPKALSTSTPKP